MLGWFGLGSGTGLRTMWSGFGGVAAKAGKGVWSKPSNSGLAVGGTAARGGAEVVGCVPARVFKYDSRPRGPSGGGTEAGAGEGRVGLSAPGLASVPLAWLPSPTRRPVPSLFVDESPRSMTTRETHACPTRSRTVLLEPKGKKARTLPAEAVFLCSAPLGPVPLGACRRQPSRLRTNPQRPWLPPLAAWRSPIPASPAADRGPSLKHL